MPAFRRVAIALVLSSAVAPELRAQDGAADSVRAAEIASKQLTLSSVRYDSLAVRIYGDVAVLTGIADNAGTFQGFPFSGKIRYTRVFVRRDGRWQAVHMQHTVMQ